MTVFEQFNYPYWERVHYWPSWFKIIILIGVSTVIFAIEYGLLLNPVLKKYETQVQLEYELMSQLRHDWGKLVNLKTLKQQINFLKKRVHERLIFLPPNDVRSPFLQYLAAHKTNLKLRYYYPAPILHHKFYSEQLIRLSLIGSYEEIIAFLISMNQPRNQMTIKEIKLLLLKKDSKNQVKLKLNISAYVHYRD